MSSEDGFLRGPYGVFLLALVASGILLLYGIRRGDDGRGVVSAGESELQSSGEQFRAEVENTFLQMSKVDARRSYDLSSVCEKYFPVGISFTMLE